MWDHSPRDVVRASQVRVHQLVKILVRRVGDRQGGRVHARAVEDEVDRPEIFHARQYGALALRTRLHIAKVGPVSMAMVFVIVKLREEVTQCIVVDITGCDCRSERGEPERCYTTNNSSRLLQFMR